MFRKMKFGLALAFSLLGYAEASYVDMGKAYTAHTTATIIGSWIADRAYTPAECGGLCDADPNCQGFYFYENSDYCALLTGVQKFNFHPSGQYRVYMKDLSFVSTTEKCPLNFRVLSNDCVACASGETNVEGDDKTQGDTQCDVPPKFRFYDDGYVANSDTIDTQLYTLDEAKSACANHPDCVAFSRKKQGGQLSPDTQTETKLYTAFIIQNFGISAAAAGQFAAYTECSLSESSYTVNQYQGYPVADNSECGAALCAENQYVLAHDCVPCPEGTTRPAGDDPTAGNTQCISSDVDCVESYATCDKSCTSVATVTTAQSGSGAACTGDVECTDGLCTRIALDDTAIEAKTNVELSAAFDGKQGDDGGDHPMKTLLNGKTTAEAQKITKRFQRVKTRVTKTDGSKLVMSEVAKTKAAQGDLRDILEAETGDDVKAVRKALLKSLAVTEPLVVQLEGTKSAVLKPPLAHDAPSTLDCATASSDDKVSSSGQVAYLQANQKIEFCYAGVKYKAQADAGGAITMNNARRRLPADVDCSSASAQVDGDEVIITAPPGCAYDAATDTFAACSVGHKCVDGIETPCPSGEYQDTAGESTCVSCAADTYNVGTGNVGCSDCATHKEDLKACSCCTGCSSCSLIAHGTGGVATLAADVMIACTDTCT